MFTHSGRIRSIEQLAPGSNGFPPIYAVIFRRSRKVWENGSWVRRPYETAFPCTGNIAKRILSGEFQIGARVTVEFYVISTQTIKDGSRYYNQKIVTKSVEFYKNMTDVMDSLDNRG